MAKRIFGVPIVLLLNLVTVAAQTKAQVKDTMFRKITPTTPLLFSQQPASFFCKKEVQLQKLMKLNLFIRLGTKDWVDYLERKPNAINKF